LSQPLRITSQTQVNRNPHLIGISAELMEPKSKDNYTK
jgi:hypothetical protein